MNTNVKVIGLTRLRIEPKSTALEVDNLTTRPSELSKYFRSVVLNLDAFAPYWTLLAFGNAQCLGSIIFRMCNDIYLTANLLWQFCHIKINAYSYSVQQYRSASPVVIAYLTFFPNCTRLQCRIRYNFTASFVAMR